MKITLIFILLFFVNCNSVFSQEIDTTINIREVSVVKSRKLIIHKPDKDIVDVKLLKNGKANVFDLLRSVPGILVSDDNIKVINKDGIKIMFNGTLKNLSSAQLPVFLKSYSASSIKYIEIIKNPGAKYSAEGDYAILNFITEKKENYFGGEISNELYREKTFKEEPHLSLNSDYKKIVASINSSWSYGKRHFRETNQKYFTDNVQSENTPYKIRNNDLSLNGDLSWQLDSSFTTEADASYYNSEVKNFKSCDMGDQNYDGKLISNSYSTSHINAPEKNISVGLSIDKKFSKARHLNARYEWFRFKDNSFYKFNSTQNILNSNETVNNHFDNITDAMLKGMSITLDYDCQLPFSISWSSGAKTIWTKTSSTDDYENSTLLTQQNSAEYGEEEYSAYSIFNKTYKKFEFQLGLRYELTHVNIKLHRDLGNVSNYGHLFPDAYVRYVVSDACSFTTGVNSGVYRPSIRNINTFSTYNTANSVSIGNLDLKPSYYLKLRLQTDCNIGNVSLFSELHYVRMTNAMSQVTTMDNKISQSTTQWENAYNTDSWGTSISAYYGFLKWIKANLICDINYEKNVGKTAFNLPSSKLLTGDFVANLNFVFDKKNHFTGYADVVYNSRQNSSITVIKNNWEVDCGLNYSCCSEKLSFGLNCLNVISPSTSGTSYANEGMYMAFHNSYHPFTVSLSATYRFGKNIDIKKHSSVSREVETRF